MDRIYFNDEWNEPYQLNNEKTKSYNCFTRQSSKKLKEELNKKKTKNENTKV